MQHFFDKSSSKSSSKSKLQRKNSDVMPSPIITNSPRHNDSNLPDNEPPEHEVSNSTKFLRKSSPRIETGSSTKNFRKLSTNNKDHKSSKEQDTSEETSRNASPHRDQKQLSADSATTQKFPRHKISLSEGKKPELSNSDPNDASKLFRKKSTDTKPGSYEHIETILSSKSRHPSPRNELKKSGKSIETLKESLKDEKQDNLPIAITTLIMKDKAGSTSSEHEGAPELTFSLDLKTIITQRTDSSFHGRVGAYFDTSFQIKQKYRTNSNSRLSFNDYCLYLTEDLNALQRKKVENINAMVAILEPAYTLQKRTEKNHSIFCRDLLEIIQCCMRTSLDTCAQNNYMIGTPDSGKPPIQKIIYFWKSTCMFEIKPLEEEQQTVFNKLLDELIENLETSFKRQTQTQEFKTQKTSRQNQKEENPLCCVPLNYFLILCDSHYITGNSLDQFIKLYNETCHGMANEFIYVPHIWDFIRRTIDKEPKHPLLETLKKLDNLLLNVPVFEDFEPGHKNQPYFKSLMHITS